MNANIILYAMEQIGLSQLEADVYMAYLNNKNLNVSHLSKDLTVHRTQIYRALTHLKESGLASEVNGQIEIEPPERLLAILKQKEAQSRLAVKQIDSYISELNSKYYSQYERPEFKVYTGQRQFFDVYNQVIQEMTTDIRFFGNIEMFHEVFDFEFQEFWTKKRIEKNLGSKLLVFNSRKHSEFVKRMNAPKTQVRILPDKFKEIGCFTLHNKKVLCWDPALPRVIKLENEVMFTTFSQIFDLLWEFCE